MQKREPKQAKAYNFQPYLFIYIFNYVAQYADLCKR